MSGRDVTQFGDPVLRGVARRLAATDICSEQTQGLVARLYDVLTTEKLGVGLAAPQVGEPAAAAVVCVQKTEARPDAKSFRLTIINPVITQTFGRRSQLWEGCISSGIKEAGLFAKVPRYRKIELEYYDKDAKKHRKTFEGLPAHVIQHEVDHLNGTLFVDRVKDPKTYMTTSEYRKTIQKKNQKP